VVGSNIISASFSAEIDGFPVDVFKGHVIVNSITIAAPSPAFSEVPALTSSFPNLAGELISTGASGIVVVGETTLSAGGSAAAVSGILLSVIPSGYGLPVSGSSTFALTPAAIEADSMAITTGAPGVITSGVPVFLGVDGLQLDSSTISLTAEIESIGGLVFSALGGYLSGSLQTSSIGGATTSEQRGEVGTLSGAETGTIKLFTGEAPRKNYALWLERAPLGLFWVWEALRYTVFKGQKQFEFIFGCALLGIIFNDTDALEMFRLHFGMGVFFVLTQPPGILRPDKVNRRGRWAKLTPLDMAFPSTPKSCWVSPRGAASLYPTQSRMQFTRAWNDLVLIRQEALSSV